MNNIENSYILQEPREWFSIDEKLPTAEERVVIRFMNPLLSQTLNNINIPLEDIKVARYIENLWIIDPPYPKYDFSPLSNKSQLNDGTIVTHWAYPNEGELQGWDTRYDRIGKYGKLKLEVYPEDEERVYHAILLAASIIGGLNREDNDMDLSEVYTVLCDLQSCIDKNNNNE